MNLSHRRKKRPTNKGLEPFSPSLVRARERGRGRRGRGRRLPFLSLPINHPDFSSARLVTRSSGLEILAAAIQEALDVVKLFIRGNTVYSRPNPRLINSSLFFFQRFKAPLRRSFFPFLFNDRQDGSLLDISRWFSRNFPYYISNLIGTKRY